MEFIAILATIMGVISSLSFFPQTIKIMRRKSSKDISLMTYGILGFGAVIWLIYGISVMDIPIIVSYTLGTISTFSVIIAYLAYR